MSGLIAISFTTYIAAQIGIVKALASIPMPPARGSRYLL